MPLIKFIKKMLFNLLAKKRGLRSNLIFKEDKNSTISFQEGDELSTRQENVSNNQDKSDIKNNIIQKENLNKEKAQPKRITSIGQFNESEFYHRSDLLRDKNLVYKGNLNRYINSIDRGCLNLFDKTEIQYFEEIERYEYELEGIEKFTRYTLDEIGLEGEQTVHIELLKLAKREYKILNNVIINDLKGKTTEIDTIIISIYGVFVIETKNYKAKIIGDEDSKYWSYYYNKRKFNNNNKLYNPIKQNKWHIKSLRVLLEGFSHKVPIYSIIVFNEEAELHVNSSTYVINVNNLVEVIQTYNKKRIDYSLIEEIYNEIQYHKLKGTKAKQRHADYVSEVIEEKSTIMNRHLSLELIITLYLTTGIGKWTIEWVHENLNNKVHNIEELLKSLSKVKNINPRIKVPDKNELTLNYQKALDLLNYYQEQGISVTSFNSYNYPNAFKGPEYPLIFFSIGDLSHLNNAKNTGILVSSGASDYSKVSARRFGEVCATYNITLTSIAGKGDNVSAVKGALSKNGKVILLVPLKLELLTDNAYSKLYKEIENNGGCVISITPQINTVNDYRKKQLNQLFLRLVDKFIAVESHDKEDFVKIINKGQAQNQKIAFFEQENSKIQVSIKNGTRIRNKYDLFKFLEIEK